MERINSEWRAPIYAAGVVTLVGLGCVGYQALTNSSFQEIELVNPASFSDLGRYILARPSALTGTMATGLAAFFAAGVIKGTQDVISSVKYFCRKRQEREEMDENYENPQIDIDADLLD